LTFGQRHQQAGELLAALDDAELGRLLDRIGGVEAGIGRARRSWPSSSAPAAGNEEKSDEFRGMRTEPTTLPPLALTMSLVSFFERRSRTHSRRSGKNQVSPPDSTSAPAGADCERMGVERPVEAVGRAGVSR